MSLTVNEIMSSVRATLDYPSPETLKQPTLLLKVQEKSEHYFNRMELTDRNWFLDTKPITVQGGKDTYCISSLIPNFGRPIQIQTNDSSDPNHIRREIDIVDMADRDLNYRGSVNAPTEFPKHSAMSATFYRKASDGLVYMLITPGPAGTAEYIIWYEPNRQLPPRLADNILFLENFRNLLITDVARTCLPYARLEDPLYSTLRDALDRDFEMYLATFEEYIANDRQQQVAIKKLWGEDRGNEEWIVF